jgi:hypothetical protein
MSQQPAAAAAAGNGPASRVAGDGKEGKAPAAAAADAKKPTDKGKGDKKSGGKGAAATETVAVHPGVYCDICQASPLNGVRYSCTVCDNVRNNSPALSPRSHS